MSAAVSVDEEIEEYEQRKQARRLHIFKLREKLDRMEDQWLALLNNGVINEKLFDLNRDSSELKEQIDGLVRQYHSIYGEKPE